MPTVVDIFSELFVDSRKLILLSESAEGAMVKRPAPLGKSSKGDVSFWDRGFSHSKETGFHGHPTLLIFHETLHVDCEVLARSGVQALIRSPDPRYDFIQVVNRYFDKKAPPPGIHATTFIAPSASIGDDVYVGPQCVIGEGSSIGNGSVIHSGVHLYDLVQIGRNVTIHSGAVIGADGFGFHRIKTGQWVKFPHLGGVLIEDDVEIGANSCVDRGTLNDTVIGVGAKIDNLVHIAHNVVIGANVVVIAHAMIGGSVRIGSGAWISPHACIRDGIEIGSDAFIGMGAVVTKSIPGGEVWAGVPAQKLR